MEFSTINVLKILSENISQQHIIWRSKTHTILTCAQLSNVLERYTTDPNLIKIFNLRCSLI